MCAQQHAHHITATYKFQLFAFLLKTAQKPNDKNSSKKPSVSVLRLAHEDGAGSRAELLPACLTNSPIWLIF
jgi:hypothetical protein